MNGIAAHIDGNKLEKIIKTKDSNDKYYSELNEYLNKSYKRFNFKYLYTVGQFEDGKFYYIVDSLFPANKDFSALGDNIEYDSTEKIQYESETTALMTGSYITKIAYYEDWGNILTAYTVIYNSKNEPVALLGADILAEQHNVGLYHLLIYVSVILLISTLIIIFLQWIYLKRVFTPMKELQSAALSISHGNLSDVDLKVKTEDEIGKTSNAFNITNNQLKAIIRKINENSKELMKFASDLSRQSEYLTNSSETIAYDVSNIADSSDTQKNDMQTILNKVTSTNSEINTIISKTNRVFSDVESSYNYAKKGEEIIKSSTSKITEANSSMHISKEKIEDLRNKINDVTKFVEVITSISSQTNLLALNAAIESARAGESGKGFGVVAAEIRKLAEQSAKAATEISSILNGIVESSNDLIEYISNTYELIENGVESSNNAESYFDNILQASVKIKNNTSDVLQNMNNYSKENEVILDIVQNADKNSTSLAESCKNISSVSQEQYANSEETKKYALELKNMSEELQESIEVFKTESKE